MAQTSRFSFVGTALIPKEKAKRPFYKEFEKVDNETKKKKKMRSMTFGVKESDTNVAFVEAFDSEQSVIYTMDSDNNKIEVDWADRFDEDKINSVASYRRYTVDLGEDYGGRRDFITLFDFMEFLNEHLPEYDGKVMVTGQFVKEWYAKGKQYFDKFHIQNVYAVEDDIKSRLSLSMEIFYNKDCLDKTDFKDNKKIYLNGYIEQYINKDEGKKMIPMQFIFSAAKYDLEGNEKHKALYNYKMQYIDVKTSKTMVHIPWDLVLVRGAEEAEFNEDMLTARQKEQIELGLKKLEDFKPRGAILGERVNEYRLFDPKLVGDFADGLVELDETMSEFEERIYQPTSEETLEEAKANSKKNKTSDDVDDEPSTPSANDTTVSDEDLF